MLAQGKADTIIHLKEVVIVKGMPDEQQRTNPLSSTTVNRQRLLENQQGSLMKTLSQLPGLSTIDIGSGHRSVDPRLGVNQVVVVGTTSKRSQQGHGSRIGN
jgi:iron complex outermembrane receptor protein